MVHPAIFFSQNKLCAIFFVLSQSTLGTLLDVLAYSSINKPSAGLKREKFEILEQTDERLQPEIWSFKDSEN